MLRGECQHNVIKSAVRGLLEIMEEEKRNVVFLFGTGDGFNATSVPPLHKMDFFNYLCSIPFFNFHKNWTSESEYIYPLKGIY